MSLQLEDLPEQINQTLYAHMDKHQRENLSLRTQMEMARGALGRAVDQEEALKYVKELGILADGERKLRAAISNGYRLHVYRDRDGGRADAGDGLVRVAVGRADGDAKDILFLREPFEGFPSDELLAKVMLVAG